MAADQSLGDGKTCFIIGPIGDRLEPLGTPGRLRYEDATQMWERVFEPACEAFGLQPIRADKITESGEIPEQIFKLLRDAEVVIADLTGGNANVMYELGLRHTRDKVTIQIGEHERLPFDVNTIRTVKFLRTEAGLIDARNSLIEALRTALQGSSAQVTATRIWKESEALDSATLASASSRSYTSDDPADLGDDDDDGPGRLELMARGEEALTSIGELLAEFSGELEEMTAVSAGLQPRLTTSDSFASRIPIIRSLAESLKEPAARMGVTSASFLNRVEEVDVMMNFIFEDFAEDPSLFVDSPEATDFPEQVIEAAKSAEEASVVFTETLKAVRDLRRVSSILKPVAKSIEHSLNTILRGNAIVASWGTRFRDLSSNA